MEQKGLRVLDTNKTFFSKITSTITKILIPTKIGVNGMMISIKRNNLIKAYNNYVLAEDERDEARKEAISRKYEDSFALYLEAIDKYIIDSVYKKVKNGTASGFESEALSRYYMVVSLKEKQYIEYKYRKQEYLLNVDYQTMQTSGKESVIEKYHPFYVSKMEGLYKGLLKTYSIQLTDGLSVKDDNSNELYNKIFDVLESYTTNILPIKLKMDSEGTYKDTAEDYDKYESSIVGKLGPRDIIKKKMILLGISRSVFTHSLPLLAAEQCYIKLLKETRELIVSQTNKTQKNLAFELLIELIEEYNIKLLSTRVYWDNPKERAQYKEFWDKYKTITSSKDANKQSQKQVLFLKYDLKKLNTNTKKYENEIKAVKEKLVELGAMRNIKCSYISNGTYKNLNQKIKELIKE